MPLTHESLRREPPGPRRLLLALRLAGGLTYADIADWCNCDRTIVSAVARGACTTDLHRRIRARAVELTGMDEAWLFATAPKAQDATPPTPQINADAA